MDEVSQQQGNSKAHARLADKKGRKEERKIMGNAPQLQPRNSCDSVWLEITAEHEKKLIRYEFVWQNIEILILQNKNICMVFDCNTDQDVGVDHLQIKSSERNPITETGYKSYYATQTDLAKYDTPTHFVSAWLDDEAKRSSWKKYVKSTQQLSLFGELV